MFSTNTVDMVYAIIHSQHVCVTLFHVHNSCRDVWFAAYVSLRIKIPSYVICNWRTPEGDLRSMATSNRITDAETIDAKDSYC